MKKLNFMIVIVALAPEPLFGATEDPIRGRPSGPLVAVQAEREPNGGVSQ